MKNLTLAEKRAMRRKLIMQTAVFQEWKQWRLTIEPTPSDMFRAFMIDLSLYATIKNKNDWRKRVNRGDSPDIDYPKVKAQVKRIERKTR